MNQKLRKSAITLAIVMIAVSLSGCEAFLELLGAGLFSVSGTAVNVAAPVSATEYWKGTEKTTATLAGATITLTNVYDTTKKWTATVGQDGSWTALDIGAGKYRITGAQTGWTFIPKEIEITGMFSSAEPVLAFETPANKEEIFIVVEWKRPTSGNAIDVDSIMAIDAGNSGTAQSAVFTTLFDYKTANGYTVPARATDASAAAVTLDRDVYGNALKAGATTPLVETMRIKSNPFGTGNGQLRYYLNAFDKPTLTGDSFGSTPIPSTYATVTVMQPAASATNGLLGIFNIALDSYEKTLGVVKIGVVGGSTTTYTIKSYGNEGAQTVRALE